MRAYSTEFRREVLAACDAGEKTKPLASRFGMSESWAWRIAQERREQGQTTRRRPTKWSAEADGVRAAISQTPDLTLDELKAKLGTSLGRSTLCRAAGAAIDLEKSWGPRTTTPRCGRTPRGICGIDPQRRVFLDETRGKTNRCRPRGRSLQGTRLISAVPHGHWTTTFSAALRVTGLTAPLVIDGVINGVLFRGWVEQQFVPTLRLATSW